MDIAKTLCVLNEAVALDEKAMGVIVGSRCQCNESLANHSTIQVGGDIPCVGILGIINGILLASGSLDVVVAVYSEGKLSSFESRPYSSFVHP